MSWHTSNQSYSDPNYLLGIVTLNITVLPYPTNLTVTPTCPPGATVPTNYVLSWDNSTANVFPFTSYLHRYYLSHAGISSHDLTFQVWRQNPDGTTNLETTTPTTVFDSSKSSTWYNDGISVNPVTSQLTDSNITGSNIYQYYITVPATSYHSWTWTSSKIVTQGCTGNSATPSADIWINVNGVDQGRNSKFSSFTIDSGSTPYNVSWTSTDMTNCSFIALGSKYSVGLGQPNPGTTTIGGPLVDSLGSHRSIIYEIQCAGPDSNFMDYRGIDNISVDLNMVPSTSITGSCTPSSTSINLGDSITFATSSIAGGNGGPYTYSLNGGGSGSIISMNPPTYRYSSPTTGTPYSPSIQITDNAGYSNTLACGNITVSSSVNSQNILLAAHRSSDGSGAGYQSITIKVGDPASVTWTGNGLDTVNNIYSLQVQKTDTTGHKSQIQLSDPNALDMAIESVTSHSAQILESSGILSPGTYTVTTVFGPRNTSFIESLFNRAHAQTVIGGSVIIRVQKANIREI